MKLLLDMGVPVRTASFLRGLGHDALHLREQSLQRLGDDEIVQKAIDEHRVVVTFDLDFPRLLASLRLKNPSIVLFRVEHFTYQQINAVLAEVLEAHRHGLESGMLVVVEQDRIRTRKLPIV